MDIVETSIVEYIDCRKPVIYNVVGISLIYCKDHATKVTPVQLVLEASHERIDRRTLSSIPMHSSPGSLLEYDNERDDIDCDWFYFHQSFIKPGRQVNPNRNCFTNFFMLAKLKSLVSNEMCALDRHSDVTSSLPSSMMGLLSSIEPSTLLSYDPFESPVATRQFLKVIIFLNSTLQMINWSILDDVDSSCLGFDCLGRSGCG